MIARLWSARCEAAAAPAYATHLRDAVLPAMRHLHGYRGATLLEGRADADVHLTVITWWDSLDDVRAFAGDDVSRAVVAEEARRLLTQFDESVQHCTVRLDERVSG